MDNEMKRTLKLAAGLALQSAVKAGLRTLATVILEGLNEKAAPATKTKAAHKRVTN